ncbi:MAG: anti-sigma factor [Candidatus Eremiobacteraeota bacterium]|nr:anti-sigma factor [Candidatus Eremiobacteraeota bacterium]
MNEITIDPIHEDLEAFALGALDRDDAERFEGHLDRCENCRRGLVSYIPVTNALRSVPAAMPPPLPAVSGPATVTPLRRRFAPVAFAYAAAAAVLLVVGGAITTLMQPRSDSALMTVAGMLADGPHQTVLQGDGVRGRLIIGRRNLRAAVVLRGLPPPTAGTAYHLWLVDAKPILVGALSPARDNLEVLLTNKERLGHGHALRVSLEPLDATAPLGAAVATGNM